MRVSPVVLVLTVVISALIGPLAQIAELPPGVLDDAAWWQGIAEDALRGAATGALAAVAVVASAWGIELRRGRNGVGAANDD